VSILTDLRIAAVGDIHLGEDVRGQYRKNLDGIEERADSWWPAT
jgi:hypothetical protein